MLLPTSPFQKEREAIDPELRGIRARAKRYVPKRREDPPRSPDVQNAAKVLGLRAGTMRASGKRYLWTDNDLERVRIVLDHLFGAAEE